MDANIFTNIIFLVGLIFLIIGLMKSNNDNIVYTKISKSLSDKQLNDINIKKEPKVEQIFKSMFEQQNPWIGSFNDYNVKYRRELNKQRGILTSKQ